MSINNINISYTFKAIHQNESSDSDESVLYFDNWMGLGEPKAVKQRRFRANSSILNPQVKVRYEFNSKCN